MHGYFYRKNFLSRLDRVSVCAAGLFVGFACLGSALYRAYPAGDPWACDWLLRNRSPLLPALFVRCLPLLTCAGLLLLPAGRQLCLLVPAECGFLAGYCAGMFFLELGREAMAASAVYLLWQTLPMLAPFGLLSAPCRNRLPRLFAAELLGCLGLELLGRLLLFPFLQALLP